MATIKDIADKCGVSTAAVSLVLNNKPNRFSNKTKQNIIRVAKELNYFPNNMAVSLVKGKSKVIGLIIPDIKNEYFSNLAYTIETKLSPHGYNIMLGNSSNLVNKELFYSKTFLGYRVDALLIVPASRYKSREWQKIVELTETSKTPIIFLDRAPVDTNYPYFISDNEYGGYIATNHLLRLGHRKIGCLTGPLSLLNTKMRMKGYERALKEYNIKTNNKYIIEGDFKIESGVSSLEYFIKKGVSAVFSFNDMMAYGLYRKAQENKIEIPDQISIIGFDDNVVSTFAYPPLSTIAQPVEQMCNEAIDYLIASLNGEKLDFNYKICDPELIIRDSVATLI